MARAKVILVDADVISHFIATDFGQEVIASSNFRDVAPFCEANGIEYIGTLDILLIAKRKGHWDIDQCNQFIMDAIKVNNARFPVSKIEDYKTEKDLSEF